MANCPSLTGCPFYHDRMANKPAMANIYKKNFCEKDYGNCASWKVANALGKEAVPSDLFPNQNERADEIINK